jgi:hypothetical protein
MNNDEIIQKMLIDKHIVLEDETIEALELARADERAKCITQLKNHQSHCESCNNDIIEMAIIILEKNEADETKTKTEVWIDSGSILGD